MRLDRHRLGDAQLTRDAHPLAHAVGGVVRDRGVAHESVGDERAEGSHGLFERGVGVVEVRVVQVDAIEAETGEGCLGRGAHVGGGEPPELRVLADLGGDRDALVVAEPAAREPLADDRLALATFVARHPGAVGVGRVDEVSATATEGVEDLERGAPVGRPAEHVAAEGEGEDVEVTRADAGHALIQASPRPAHSPVTSRRREAYRGGMDIVTGRSGRQGVGGALSAGER